MAVASQLSERFPISEEKLVEIKMFSPFQTTFAELKTADLGVLRDVSEGWYVEYKTTVGDVRSVAKSISAFANHHGGWVFYGIKGTKDGSNHAAEFNGIPKTEVPRIQQRISDSVSQHINPSPYFEMKVLDGPDVSLKLSATNSLIALRIPSGHRAPYVHSTGRIYRRIGDQSDPVAESDRAVLDMLWDRSRRSRKRLKRSLLKSPELSESESKIVLLTAFLYTDPIENENIRSAITFDEFVAIMKTDAIPPVDFPATNFFSCAEGYYARQPTGNDPIFHTLTWKHLLNGSSIVTCPLQTFWISGWFKNAKLLHYQNCEAFAQVVSDSGHKKDVPIVDLNPLPSIIAAFLNKQSRLMAKGNLPGKLHVKFRVSGTWRRLPFLDTPQFIKFIEEYGVPIIQESSFMAPHGFEVENFQVVETRESPIDSLDPLMVESFILCNWIFTGFGLEQYANTEERIKELFAASDRGTKAYRQHI